MTGYKRHKQQKLGPKKQRMSSRPKKLKVAGG